MDRVTLVLKKGEHVSGYLAGILSKIYAIDTGRDFKLVKIKEVTIFKKERKCSDNEENRAIERWNNYQ